MTSKADLHRHLAHQIELKTQALKRVTELEAGIRYSIEEIQAGRDGVPSLDILINRPKH